MLRRKFSAPISYLDLRVRDYSVVTEKVRALKSAVYTGKQGQGRVTPRSLTSPRVPGNEQKGRLGVVGGRFQGLVIGER